MGKPPRIVFDPVTAQRIASQMKLQRLQQPGGKVDYNFVDNRLATGAALSGPDDVKAMVDAGITHVIDCRGEFDDAPLFAQFPQIHYLYNGTNDDGQPKSVEWFQKSIEFALQALSLPNTKVYAHCAAGSNRGPSTAYSILRAQGLDGVTSMNMIKLVRPQAAVRYAPDADSAIKQLGYE